MPRRSNRAQENRYADSSDWLETSVNGGQSAQILGCLASLIKQLLPGLKIQIIHEFNYLVILASLGNYGIHAIQ